MNRKPPHGAGGDDVVERMAAAAARDYDLSVERAPGAPADADAGHRQRALPAQPAPGPVPVRCGAAPRSRSSRWRCSASPNSSARCRRPPTSTSSRCSRCAAAAWWCATPALISALVDALYGGAGKLQAPIEGRDFSPTEQRVIQRLLGVVCTEYNKAWKDVYPLTLDYQRSETHAQFVNVAAPAEMVVVTTLQLTHRRLRRRHPHLHALRARSSRSATCSTARSRPTPWPKTAAG